MRKRFVFRIGTTAAVYLTLVVLTEIAFSPAGDPLKFENVNIPFSKFLMKPTWLHLHSVLHSDGKKTYLVLPRMDCQGLEVKLNGDVIFKLGGDGVSSKIWMSTFPVLLNLKKGLNEIDIGVWGRYNVNIPVPPFLSEDPWGYVYLSNALFTWFPGFMFPVLIALGIFYIYSAFKIPENRNTFTFMGISSAFSGLFLAYYITMPQFAPVNLYHDLFNRIYLISLIPMLAFYYAAIESFVGSTRYYKWVISLSAILALVMVFERDYHYVSLMAVSLTPVLAIFLITLAVAMMIRSGFLEYSISCITLEVSVFHYFVNFLSGRINHTVLVFGISYNAFEFLRYMVHSYQHMSAEREKAYRDPLTGVYNRRVLERVDISIEDTVVFLDIDDFKRYNDIHGHDHGDRILITLARVISSNVKGKDTVLRFGGDEFVLILKDCDDRCANDIMRRISEDFRELTGCEISHGLAKVGESLEEAMRVADRAMYSMKRSKGLHGSLNRSLE